MIAEIKQEVSKVLSEVVDLRRWLHQHPELSFQEFETSKKLREALSGLDVKLDYPIAGEGFSVLIEGEQPGPTVLLRGDMDALPIQEQTNVPFKSVHEGVMHACGHDVHSACLVGVVKVLAAMKKHIKGSVKCMFQPGEEKLPGGASLMIQEGILECPKVSQAYAQHVFPELEVGKVGFRSGMYMASCDEVYVDIEGVGGHGAMPHAVKDPVLAMAHMITGLQSIVSRSCPPPVPCVLSFGRVEALGATNVIPSKVSIQGTFRTLNEAWRSEAHQLIVNQANQLVEAMGCKATVRIEKGYPFVDNSPEVTERAKELAKLFLGEENVVDLPLRMTGEDFAFITHAVPSCFYRLGTRNEALGQTQGVHHPQFEANEGAIETGVGLMAYLALEGVVG